MQNQLQAGDSGAVYHTYVIEVPPGLSTLTVVARGDADVDLFAKYGSDINGDADYSDITSSTSAIISVANPQAGMWYFDVVWLSDAGLVSYVIEAYSLNQLASQALSPQSAHCAWDGPMLR